MRSLCSGNTANEEVSMERHEVMDYNKIEDGVIKTNAVTYIDGGTVKYTIKAFYMNNLDGDENG